MGKLTDFQNIKLIIGIIFQKDYPVDQLIKKIEQDLGKIDFISENISFNNTNYYENEMGPNLLKKFISFEKLWDVEKTSQVKLYTNKLEEEYSENNKRPINLDPGILTLPNIILFSTKNFFHRIPILNNIYAEVTLYWHNKKYQDLPWTYPDYKTEAYKSVLTTIRNTYKNQLNLS
jgi:hypothetical protein